MIPLSKTDKDYNKCIDVELKKAGVDIVEDSIFGKLGDWTLRRDYKYWAATVPELSLGLPLNIAAKMHEKKYPDEMFDEHCTTRVYGDKIRSGGHCGCPHPAEYGANSAYDKENKLIGKFVKCYHIDSQEGLNEFVRTIKSLK